MRYVLILICGLLLHERLVCQDLSKKLLHEKNAITISFVNYSSDTCIKAIYIGENDTLYYPCIYKKECAPVDISSDRALIIKLSKIMNTDFFKKLENCCQKKDCPDVGYEGYYMEIMANQVDEGFSFDLNYYNKGICVSKDLKEVIDILNTIIAKYKQHP